MEMTTEMRGMLSTRDSIRRYLEAGNAHLTVRSVSTGQRFTFRFRKTKGAELDAPIFASVLSGPDNNANYSFVGTMFAGARHQVRWSAKSRVSTAALSYRALTWLLAAIYEGDGRQLAKVEVWHEGRCGRCGRRLTVPESVASGIGPECASRC